MRGFNGAAVLLLASAASLCAAEPAPMPHAKVAAKVAAVDAAEPALVGPISAPWLVELKAKNVAPAAALRWQIFVKNRDGDYVLAVGKVQARTVAVEKAYLFAGPPGEYLVLCSFQKGQEFVELEWRGSITGGVTPPIPPPVPPDPKPPTPPDPKPPAPPVPVTSFRVLLIYESGDTLTAQQNGVLYGRAVEDYLNAKCTKDGTLAGWRRRDRDSSGEGDPAMAALWAAVKAKLKPTDTPCVAMERNGNVEIVPLEATPAKMIEVLEKYRGK